MGVFDQAKLRDRVRSGARVLLDGNLSESEAGRYVAADALGCYEEAVRAALCHMDDTFDQLLAKAQEWLEIAIREREVPENSYCPDAHEGDCRSALAVIGWLRTGTLDQALLSDACDYLTRHLQRRKTKSHVSHRLPAFVLARKWPELQAAFRACKDLSPSATHRGIKCPGKMSYLIAEHELTGHPEREKVRGALGAFMAYLMPNCLMVRKDGLGTWRDVPTWTLIEELHGEGARGHGASIIRQALAYVKWQA